MFLQSNINLNETGLISHPKKEGIKMDINEKALNLHYELQGKIEVVSRRSIETRRTCPSCTPPA